MCPSPSVAIDRRSSGESKSRGNSPPNRHRLRRSGFHHPSRPRSAAEPIQIEHDLDRSPILLAEVHHPVRRILGIADGAGQVRDITHCILLVCDETPSVGRVERQEKGKIPRRERMRRRVRSSISLGSHPRDEAVVGPHSDLRGLVAGGLESTSFAVPRMHSAGSGAADGDAPGASRGIGALTCHERGRRDGLWPEFGDPSSPDIHVLPPDSKGQHHESDAMARFPAGGTTLPGGPVDGARSGRPPEAKDKGQDTSKVEEEIPTVFPARSLEEGPGLGQCPGQR